MKKLKSFRNGSRRQTVWPDGDEPAPAAKPKAAFPMQERIAVHWAWKNIERPTVPKSNMPTGQRVTSIALTGENGRRGDHSGSGCRSSSPVAAFPDSRSSSDRLQQLSTRSIFQRSRLRTPVAMEKVVDELLASPQYGERWGRHWLDLVRYAETLGHEFDYPLPYAWRYRDYVIQRSMPTCLTTNSCENISQAI